MGPVNRVNTFRVLLMLGVAGTVACKSKPSPQSLPSPVPSVAGQTGSQSGSGGAVLVAGHDAPQPPPIETPRVDPPVAGMSAAPTAGTSASQAGVSGSGMDAGASGAAAGQGSAGDAGGAGAAGGQSGSGEPAAGSGGMSGSGSESGGLSLKPGKRGEPGSCRLPSSCQTINSIFFTFTACCLEGNECGYELTSPPELRDLIDQTNSQAGSNDGFGAFADCVPATEIFRRTPGEEARRVTVPYGTDQLITPECESRALLEFPLPGCCLPDNRCGVSTHLIYSILGTIAVFPAPFGEIECVTVDELNRQFRASTLAGAAQLPPSDGTCNYADLNARFPPE